MTRDYTIKRSKTDESVDDVIEDVHALIGMAKIKEELNELVALGRIIAVRRELDIPVEKFGLHLVFTGPPGTGKTIMARKIGKLFKAIGLLQRGHCVEVDRSKLVGSHLGEAGQLVMDAFKQAQDGVLFIDEAYALAGGTGMAGGDHYGNEAINTLLKLMEDYRDRVVVIVAGYTTGMRRFLDNNVGLKSRFARTFEFRSYTHEELVQIFQFMAKEGSYILDEDALDEVRVHIRDHFNIDREDFGNAREVRNLFEKIIPAQAMRFYQQEQKGGKKLEQLTRDELLTITGIDVSNAIG
jgi:SpoVK/Ycf46/Vps4 family AAA+-type ATPase